jgi:colanic acid biosynthesis glycosyl transferase WcaI
MYEPEQYASAPLNTQAAEYFAGRGHAVNVLTSFPHYPQWSVWPEWRGRAWSNEVAKSVHIRRIRSYIPSRPGTVGRVAHYAGFAAASLAGLAGLPRPDVIVCVTPPIELAYSGAIWSRLHRAKLVLWVKDLVPEIAIQLGMLRNPAAIWLGRRVEHGAYRLADRLVVICDGFRRYLSDLDCLAAPIDVVPDWVDPRPFQTCDDREGTRERLGLPRNGFVAVHSGNMGRKQALETIVQMAAQLKPEDETVVLLVGGGSERSRLEALAKTMDIRFLRFLPMLSREEYPALLSAADLLLVHQKAEASETVIPSKLLAYMASGKPILAGVNGGSETAKTIGQTGAGIVVPPEDPSSLCNALADLRQQPLKRKALGEAGARAVAERFARDVVLKRLEEVLVQTVELGPVG